MNVQLEDTAQGNGSSVPPDLKQVKIYFSQKDQPDYAALLFFREKSLSGWRNYKGVLIKNWKQHAWCWILNNGH